MSLKNRLLSKKNSLKSELIKNISNEADKKEQSSKNLLKAKDVDFSVDMPCSSESLHSSVDLLGYFENNPDISQLIVYGPDSIFVEKNGALVQSELSLGSVDCVIKVIENIANQYDKIINTANPSINIVLSNGVKINAIIPPMIREGAYLSLKRISRCSSFSSIIEEKIASNEMILFFKECLNMNQNILLVSSAKVDKINILNFLANKISDKENIITLETIPRLKIKSDMLLSLIKQKSNFQKIIKKAINLPHDKIIISESTVNELVSVCSLINAGNNGFITSFSSKSYNEMLTSIKNLIMLEYPNLTEQNTNSLLLSSIDLIIFVDKTKDGTVRITNVSELVKTKNGLSLQDIFVWKDQLNPKAKKLNGLHSSTGVRYKNFTDHNFSTLGFIEDYFAKEYKHNYIGKIHEKETVAAVKTARTKAIKTKINKYKELKQKIKDKD